MKQAALENRTSGKVSPLPRKCRIGSHPRSNLVIAGPGILPQHCVIWRGTLGGWRLRQLGIPDSDHGGAPVPSTVIRRRGRTTFLLTGDCWHLKDGDEIAFGKPHRGEPEFSYAFRSGKAGGRTEQP